MSETRKHILKFRVDDKELCFLKKKAEMSNCRNMSDFLRRISLGGAIYNVDMSDFAEMKNLIRNISNNINQIATAANRTHHLYSEEIEEIQKEVDEIWRQQAYILSQLHRLEP